MAKASTILDELEKKERRRNILGIIISVLFIMTLAAAWILYSAGEPIYLHGTAVGISGTAGDKGDNVFLRVIVNDGRDIQIKLPARTPYIKDSPVIITEKRTKLFGIKRYSFVQYGTTEAQPLAD